MNCQTTKKQRSLNLLSSEPLKAGCVTHHATGDTDVLITMSADNSVKSQDTVLVGDDTDLIVLLLHHCQKGKLQTELCTRTQSVTLKEQSVVYY